MAVGMGGAMLFYQVFVPLLLVATPSSSEKVFEKKERVFGLTGGSIVLQAEQVTGVTSIIWKHNKDKAAEWFEGDNATSYFNIFTSVTKLDMQTWALTISNLKPDFDGDYSAEVNNKEPTKFVTLTVLGPVSKPTITMDCNDINCNLTCEGKEDDYTKYTWANAIQHWPGSKLTVEMKDSDLVYTCTFSNGVSSAYSNGTVKKYVPPPSPSPGPGTTIPVVVVVVVLLLIAALITGRLWQVLKRKGKGLTDLPTMSSQDRTDIWRSYISCNNGDENPPEVKTDGEGSPTENGPRSTAKTSVVFIAEGENKEPDACEENQRLLITGAGENPANNQTPLLGNGETEHKEHEEGEENPGDEGKQQLPNTVTSQGPSGEHKSPEAVLAGDEKQAGANQDPSPEGAGENPANNQTPLLGNGETEHKELEGGEENPGDEGKQQLPNTVTPPVPSGEDNSPELDHRLPSVTERKEPDGNEDSPGMPNPEDKRQPETDPDPAPEGKLPANAPGSTAEEEHKEPEGGEKSSEKTNTEDKRQPETDTDPLLEGKLPANAPGSTAEEEDKRQPETDTDPLLEGKLPANAPGSTAEEENNEAHGGKESPEKTNTEDEKLPKADTDQLHEEKLGEPVETSTGDGENNEAHGGKESPEKTNTEH